MRKAELLCLPLLALVALLPAWAPAGDERRVAGGLKSTLYISEVCVRPPPGTDWPAWIELWNNSQAPVDLAGYSLATLQAKITPLGNSLIIKPDARCLVLCYPGKGISEDFEKTLPPGTKLVRLFEREFFPPYCAQNEWLAKLSADLANDVRAKDPGLAPAELVKKLLAETSQYIGTTRYINEIALRSATGELVAYAAWGDMRQVTGNGGSLTTPAMREAEKKLDMRDSYPNRLSVTDNDCEVVQLKHHGRYAPLRLPLRDMSPGRPLDIKADPPRPQPVARLELEGTSAGGAFRLELACDLAACDPIFEPLVGWSRMKYEICHDRGMTLPVFKTGLEARMDEPLVVWLTPVDFFCLVGKPLYWRASKRHPDRPALISDVKEFELSSRGLTFPREDNVPQFPKAPAGRPLPWDKRAEYAEMNYAAAGVDPEKVAGYIAKCNAAMKALESTEVKHDSVKCDIKGALDEVTMLFHKDPSFRATLATIACLAGLPIRELDLAGSQVKDLTPLRGMPLVELNLRNVPVTDLAVLKGMPLATLDIAGTKVTDLSLLAGLPLTRLVVDRSRIGDLGFLAGTGTGQEGGAVGIDFIEKDKTRRRDGKPQ